MPHPPVTRPPRLGPSPSPAITAPAIALAITLIATAPGLRAATVPPKPALSPTPGIAAALTIDISKPANYARPVLPLHYTGQALPVNTPGDNPVTDKGATLGQVLFWDKALSVNNTVACATCHQGPQGFGAATPLSKGFLGQTGTRHAMRLGNVAYYAGQAMFWDKRAATLELQATQPVQNSLEMGYDAANGGLNALLVKMQARPYYPELFTAVYGDPAITEARIQKALAQFMRSMASAGSRWDAGYAQVFSATLPDKGLGRPVPGFTAQENRGKDLFMTAGLMRGPACAACHRPPTFALDRNAKSNGLDVNESTVFKAPSLKNIAQGQAMMHDGRFTTLEQVVAHYDHGIQPGPALDAKLINPQGRPVQLGLGPADQAALVAFLKTLQDPAFKTDARFGDPFRH